MRLTTTILALGVFVAVGCAGGGPTPESDSSGLVRIPTKPGDLFAHPSRSIDDYDDIVVGDVQVSYAPGQEPLSEQDTRRLRSMVYEIITTQIPAAGQLAVDRPGPCTVRLDVALAELEFPKPGSRTNGGTTITLEFRDSLNGDPVVRYRRHRELGMASSPEASELERLKMPLAIAATDLRLSFRDVLPLNATGVRAAQGCKGTIGQVRKAAKEAQRQ